MNAADYRRRRNLLGLTAGRAASLLRVDARTERRWASEAQVIPETVDRVFRQFAAIEAAERFLRAEMRDFAEALGRPRRLPHYRAVLKLLEASHA